MTGRSQTGAVEQALEMLLRSYEVDPAQARHAHTVDLVHSLVTEYAADPRLDRIVDSLQIEPVAVSARQAAVARAAYRRYGRGSGSPARLNHGDCFAYALSTVSSEPLLFVGEDLAHTEVSRAMR